jgi:hypothetical protein
MLHGTPDGACATHPSASETVFRDTTLGPLPFLVAHRLLRFRRAAEAGVRSWVVADNGDSGLHSMWRIPTRSLCRMKSENPHIRSLSRTTPVRECEPLGLLLRLEASSFGLSGLAIGLRRLDAGMYT